MNHSYLFIYFLLLLWSDHAISHCSWNYPVPRSTNTGIKSYPCGSYEFFGSGQSVTTLQPGVVTVEWYESIYHEGAPFRIALSIDDDNDYDSYILMDHIPHLDNGMSYNVYSYNITIPNINCSRCSLQLVNPMTDKTGGECCPYPTGTGACFSVYHSCANIIITGTVPTSEFQYTYSGPSGPYSQESGNWVERGGSYWLEGPITYDSSVCTSTSTGQTKNSGHTLHIFVMLQAILLLLTSL